MEELEELARKVSPRERFFFLLRPSLELSPPTDGPGPARRSFRLARGDREVRTHHVHKNLPGIHFSVFSKPIWF